MPFIFLFIKYVCYSPCEVGFTALLILAEPLKTPDMAFMVIVQQLFPAWVLGLVGGAGALACMVPAGDLLLSTSMLFTRNVYGRTFGKELTFADKPVWQDLWCWGLPLLHLV